MRLKNIFFILMLWNFSLGAVGPNKIMLRVELEVAGECIADELLLARGKEEVIRLGDIAAVCKFCGATEIAAVVSIVLYESRELLAKRSFGVHWGDSAIFAVKSQDSLGKRDIIVQFVADCE